MKLTFLGTRGEIEERTAAHQRHTSLLLSYRRRRVMVDCGADWLGQLDRVKPHVILLTHAHPDHAWGLERGAPCPVYATDEAWAEIKRYPIADRHVVMPRRPFALEDIVFEAFPVEHSIRCPAVGYRIAAGRARVFYAPDLVYIHDREEALRDAQVYVGDGATIGQTFVRKQGERLIGHAPVRTQLGWCEKEGVPWAVITHCGKQIVTSDREEVEAKLDAWGRERGVKVTLAHDGLELLLR